LGGFYSSESCANKYNTALSIVHAMGGSLWANRDAVFKQRVSGPGIKAAVGYDAANFSAQLHKSVQGCSKSRGWAGFIKERVGNML
jgi:hypothetical protein